MLLTLSTSQCSTKIGAKAKEIYVITGVDNFKKIYILFAHFGLIAKKKY